MYEAQDLGSGREYALKVIKGTKVLWVFLCFKGNKSLSDTVSRGLSPPL